MASCKCSPTAAPTPWPSAMITRVACHRTQQRHRTFDRHTHRSMAHLCHQVPLKRSARPLSQPSPKVCLTSWRQSATPLPRPRNASPKSKDFLEFGQTTDRPERDDVERWATLLPQFPHPVIQQRPNLGARIHSQSVQRPSGSHHP